MPALFVFLLKVNIALLLFCAGYYLVLRHLTFYTLNRAYLMVAILFATLYPKIDLTDFALRHETLAKPVQSVALSWQAPAQTLIKPLTQPNYWQWATVIFWMGAVFLAFRLVMQLFSLLQLYRRSKPERILDHDVRVIEGEAAPFSFWRSIYVNPNNHTPADLKAILLHEQVHVNGWHTIDILLAELSSIFYWFNPGIWLMKKAVRENIEFITDRKILNNGIDSKTYQYSLVNVSFSAATPGIVNHFNISTIKKRIIMMNAKRSSRATLTRYAFVVPAVIVLLLVFTLSKADVAKPVTRKISVAMKPVTNALTKAAKTVMGLKDTIIVKEFTLVPSKKINGVKIPAKTVYAFSSQADTGKKIKLLVSKNLTLDSMTFVVNGVRANADEFKKLSPSKIASINIVDATTAANKKLLEGIASVNTDRDTKIAFVTTTDSEAGKVLAEKLGANRWITDIKIFRQTDKTMPFNGKDITIYEPDSTLENKIWFESSKGKMLYRTAPDSVLAKLSGKQTLTLNNLTYVTGNVATLQPTLKGTDVRKLASTYKLSDVQTVNGAPLTFNNHVQVFKSSGGVGEIFYTSKGISRISDKMVIIDGKEASAADMKKLSAFDIDRIDIKSDAETIKKHGTKAKNGVVYIYTKKR